MYINNRKTRKVYQSVRRALFPSGPITYSINEQGLNPQNPMVSTVDTSNAVIPMYGRGWETNGSEIVPLLPATSYPKNFLKLDGNQNRTITTYSPAGVGSGVMFWATDANNWYAATTDTDSTQSVDTYYYCSSFYCANYNCYRSYNYNGYRGYSHVGCQQSYCAGYACNGYSPAYTNARYNGRINILQSIAGTVSLLTFGLYNYTPVQSVSVSFDGNGNVTAQANGTGWTGTSASTGPASATYNSGISSTSGPYIGIIQAPSQSTIATSSGYITSFGA